MPASPPPPRDEPAATRLAGHVRVVSSLTLLSRFFGLGRDLVTARVFGASAIGSAFNAAFAIPNLFRRLLGEGALSAAFLPEYSSAHRADPALASRFASLTLALLLAASGALVLLGELVLLILLLTLPDDPDRVLSLRLLMVTLPYMPLVCAAAVLAGMLQVHHRFAAPAAGPILLNVVVILAGLLYLARPTDDLIVPAFVVSAATLLAGAMQAAWFVFLLRGRVRWSRGFAGARPLARRMIARFLPAVVGAGTLQINALLDTLIAMWPVWVGPTLLTFAYPLDKSSTAVLAYSQRLYQFPLGVFGIAVATAAFPALARHAADSDRFAQTLRHALRLSFFIALPASVGLLLVREPLTFTLFSGGSKGFDADAVARSAAVLAGYAPGVWAFSLNQALTRAFYARGDTRTPMRVSLAAVGLNLVLNVALIWPLSEAGLAWSTSLCALAQTAALLHLARARLSIRVLDPGTLRAGARILALTVVMGVGVWLLPGPGASWRSNAFALALATGVGLAIVVALAAIFRLSELRWLLSRSADEDSDHADRP